MDTASARILAFAILDGREINVILASVITVSMANASVQESVIASMAGQMSTAPKEFLTQLACTE